MLTSSAYANQIFRGIAEHCTLTERQVLDYAACFIQIVAIKRSTFVDARNIHPCPDFQFNTFEDLNRQCGNYGGCYVLVANNTVRFDNGEVVEANTPLYVGKAIHFGNRLFPTNHQHPTVRFLKDTMVSYRYELYIEPDEPRSLWMESALIDFYRPLFNDYQRRPEV